MHLNVHGVTSDKEGHSELSLDGVDPRKGAVGLEDVSMSVRSG